MAIVTAVEQAILLSGETVVLRRLVGTDRVPVELGVKATVRLATGAPTPLAGSAAEDAFVVTITNVEIAAAQWPGPPRKRDQIVRTVGADAVTMTIDAVDTRKYGEDILMHVLYCAG